MRTLLTILLAACSLAAWSQPQLIAGYTTTYDDQFETYTSTSIPLAQTFVVDQGDEFILDYVKLRLYSYDGASYGTLTVEIYATDANDFPTGSALATGTMGGGITTSTAGEEYNIEMSIYTLTGGTDPAGTTYAIVISTTGYAVFWKCDVNSTYSSGYGERYSSGAWSKTLDGNPVDFLFEVWGAIGSAPPSGGGGFKLVQPSGHLSLLIGGSAYNYVGVTGTLPPNPDPPTGSIFELNAAMTPGINAYGTSLGSWSDAYFQDMADAGFNSVRIVSYDAISTSGMANLKTKIDAALAAGLIPVYGPWDPAFKTDNSQANIDEFIEWMDFISAYFADYAPNQLVLELTNEPENLPYDTWNTVVADAVAAIRANDPDRPIMISPQYWGQVQGLPYLEVPDDTMLIMSVHLYRPETFVWQGTSLEAHPERADWVGTEWYPILPFQDEVEEWFAPMVTWAAANPTVACNVGEFGATKNADNASRARFAEYHAWYFEQQGWSHHWWDYYNDYGVYYPDGDSTSTIIVDALTSPSAPPSIPLTVTTVYQSNFSNTVGWTASTDVSLTASGGYLVATATSASSDYLDRYIYTTVPLEQFKNYRITIGVQSTRSTAVFTLGGPYMWELMTGIQAYPYWTSFDYSFTFSWVDDADAVLRLNIGGAGTTTLYVSSVLVEEISITP